MFSSDKPKIDPLFHYYAPLSEEFRGLLSIPHSGEVIPKVFKKYLSGNTKAYHEDLDFKVNELVDIRALQEAGIAVIVSNIHRICIDLNRAPSEALLNWVQNTKGEPIVVSRPSEIEAQKLINKFHSPYFEVLKATLQDLEKRKKSPVTMIDLHSMPSTPTEYHLAKNPNQKNQRDDFCLSNRNGKTSSDEFIEFFNNELKARSFTSSLNDPYIGGFITEFVDGFDTNNIQIEINRKIYMDEKMKLLRTDEMNHLRVHLTEILIKGFSKFNS